MVPQPIVNAAALPAHARLHLGCGDRFIRGFLHVDARPLPHVDIVTPLDRLPMLPDESASLVYASHVLEHFPRYQTVAVLTEWRRILEPGGLLRLAVPDFEKLIQVYEMSSRNLDAVLGPLVGRQDHPYNFHYMAFDRRKLTTLLLEAGFREVREWDWRATEHADVDDFSQAYYPHMEKTAGVLISLNLEAVK
ncbi:MAG TPA: methyltransferase domain-containing protein [Vicinamibacterales bacterium]|jgi:predicted SAM-dependent methyltransferase